MYKERGPGKEVKVSVTVTWRDCRKGSSVDGETTVRIFEEKKFPHYTNLTRVGLSGPIMGVDVSERTVQCIA